MPTISNSVTNETINMERVPVFFFFFLLMHTIFCTVSKRVILLPHKSRLQYNDPCILI